MMRTGKRSRKQEPQRLAPALPQFSEAFVAEVARCESIADFQELLERKGLWLNRNAAEGVFNYLHEMSASQRLSDKDLETVIGGVSTGLMPDERLVATLQILADQLAGGL